MVAVQDLKGRKCLMPELRLDLFWIMGFTTQNCFYHIIYIVLPPIKRHQGLDFCCHVVGICVCN